jgi:hypothetical protein
LERGLRAATADFWRGLLLAILRGAVRSEVTVAGFGFGFVLGVAAVAAGPATGFATAGLGSNRDGGPSGAGDRMAPFRSNAPPSMPCGCDWANEVAPASSAAVKNDNFSNRLMGFTASRRVPLAQTHMIGRCAGKGIFPSQNRVFCGYVLD